MKMAPYECRVILFIISLCWCSALHQERETGNLHDSPRGRVNVVQEQSCPPWYLETKQSRVSRCVCGTTLEGAVRCNDATQETQILAGYCLSYDDTINDTVVGRCSFNYHYLDTRTFYVTLPNDTSQLNRFMCSGLN